MSFDPEAEMSPPPTAPAGAMPMPGGDPAAVAASPAVGPLMARMSTHHGLPPEMAAARAKGIVRTAHKMAGSRKMPSMSRTKIA